MNKKYERIDWLSNVRLAMGPHGNITKREWAFAEQARKDGRTPSEAAELLRMNRREAAQRLWKSNQV